MEAARKKDDVAKAAADVKNKQDEVDKLSNDKHVAP